MPNTSDFPGLSKFLDPTEGYIVELEVKQQGEDQYLLVTQIGEIDSGQMLFLVNGDSLSLLYDDVNENFQEAMAVQSYVSMKGKCSPSSSSDHEAMLNMSEQSVDNFSSIEGPDDGNLACVWAVRMLAKKTLGRLVTGTDLTTTFDRELQRGYGKSFAESDVDAGGIIISPTGVGKNGHHFVGHVGLLGPKDHERVVYSNSSTAKQWRRHFTIDSWRAKYQGEKGLPVRFYPLPHYKGENLL